MFLIQIRTDRLTVVFLFQFLVADVFHLIVWDMNQGQFARALRMTTREKRKTLQCNHNAKTTREVRKATVSV